MPRQFARRPYFRSVRGIMFAFSKLRKKTRARGPRGCRTSLILALCLTHSTSAAAARGHQSRGPKAPAVAHWRVSNTPSPRRARLRSTAWRARSRGAVSAARSRDAGLPGPALPGLFFLPYSYVLLTTHRGPSKSFPAWQAGLRTGLRRVLPLPRAREEVLGREVRLARPREAVREISEALVVGGGLVALDGGEGHVA